MRKTRLLCASLGSLAILASLGGAASGQETTAPSAVRCDAVLTAEEAAAIVGDAYAGPAVDEPRPGFTRCEWQGTDSNFGFTFASLKSLADDQTTPDQEFENDVSAVESDTNKRELVPDVGVRTAIVSAGEDAWLVAVQRADGVARMIVYKVDRAKALALARAIAAP
jgi:hypothetical protein